MPAAPPPPAPTIAPPLSPAAAQLEAGRGLIARGDAGAAVVPLREALRLEPDLVDAQASLGQALLGIGDVEGAIDELRAALRRRPDDTRARLHLATALMARQDWPRARAELEEVARRRPDALQAHYGLGAVRYTQGDLPGAITAYRRVLEIDPAHGDARYHLALALKLARRELEATREMRAAAEAGVPRAQYFLGAALAAGNGSDRDLAGAVRWWIRAAERGVPQADAALAQLRLVALGRARAAPGERAAAELAFREFRAGLWSEHPDLARPAIGAEDGVGAALVREGRAAAALPVLLREAAALGDPAQRQLEALYEQGLGDLAPYEPRILEYLQAAAAEGQLRPRLALARIYARGLGVPADVARATALLRATPHEEAQRLLRELVP